MKECPFCNSQIKDDSLYCTECGKELPQENVKIKNDSPKKKYMLPIFIIVLVLVLIGCGWYFYGTSNTTTDNDTQSVAADSLTMETENEAGSTEQVIEEKKRFLESFYKKYDSSEEYDEAYIKSIVTNKALQVLKKHYCRGEGGDDDPNGIACWLFNYYNGWVACGSVISRDIISKGGDTFLVSTKYKEVEKYEVELSVVKDGESYKIDDIKPIGEDDGDMKSQEELAETNTAIGAFTVDENDDGNDSIR